MTAKERARITEWAFRAGVYSYALTPCVDIIISAHLDDGRVWQGRSTHTNGALELVGIAPAIRYLMKDMLVELDKELDYE